MVKEFFRLVGMRLLSVLLWIAMFVATLVWYAIVIMGAIFLMIPCWLLFGDGFIWMPDTPWFMSYYDNYYKKIEKLQDEYNKKIEKHRR